MPARKRTYAKHAEDYSDTAKTSNAIAHDQEETEQEAGLNIPQLKAHPESLNRKDILQLQRTVGNQAVMRLLNKTAPKPAPAEQPTVIQRVVRVDSKYLKPERREVGERGGPVGKGAYDKCMAWFETAIKMIGRESEWPHLKLKLYYWLNAKQYYFNFTDTYQMLEHLVSQDESPNKEKITPENRRRAKGRRNQERFSQLMKPFQVQTPQVVPGMRNIPDKELIRLNHLNNEQNLYNKYDPQTGFTPKPSEQNEEKQFWMRDQDDGLFNYKLNNISSEEEMRIMAAGNQNNPTYTVYDPRLQAMHGMRFNPSQDSSEYHNRADESNRTYGHKNKAYGVNSDVKMLGGTDGHGVPAQHSQYILGPYQEDTTHWTSSLTSKKREVKSPG